jgi:hypothetical protein
VQRVVFGNSTNALVDIPGRPPRDASPAPIDVAGQPSTSFSFYPATPGQAVTIPFTVTDSCGDWPTFVGGGAAAFAAPTSPPASSPTATPSRTPTPPPIAKAGAVVTADLGASQQVIGGQAITVYWSGLTTVGLKDQIGLYRTSDVAPDRNRLPDPVLTGGSASGNANVTITNDALLPGTLSDTFLFVVYRVDAGAPTPAFVTQSQPFAVVSNTVARGQDQGAPADPARTAKPAGGKSMASSETKGASNSSRVAFATPGPARAPAATPVAGNDNFASAFPIGALSASFSQSTAGAMTEGGEPTTCSGVPFGKTVWYSVTAGPGSVTVDTYGSNFDTVLAVYTGSAVNSLSLVGCNDDSSATKQSQVTFPTSPGTTYHIQAGGYASAGGNLILHVARTAPVNDSFDARIPVAVPTQAVANTDGATVQGGEPTFIPCRAIEPGPPDWIFYPATQAGIGQTVWYKLNPAAGTVVTIDTQGSSFDTVLAVYTGSAVTALTLVACNDDGTGGKQSRVTFTAAGSTEYQVQVGGFAKPNTAGGGTLGSSASGSLSVSFSLTTLPPNNDFAAAIPVAIPTRVAAVTLLATTQPGVGEPAQPPNCGDHNPGIGRTVWYTVTPANGAVVTLDTVGSDFDTVLAVYQGNALGSLTPVQCNDDAGGVKISQVSFVANGSPYRIQVGGYTDVVTPAVSGNLVLNVASTPNDYFASPYEVAGMQAGVVGRFIHFDTSSATTESNEPLAPTCEGGSTPVGRTLWYRFELQVPATVQVDTFGSNPEFDTVLAVYTGNTLGSLSLVACNDNANMTGQSLLSFNATPGTRYYVQAGGKGSGLSASFGFLAVGFDLLAPANDNRASATVVVDGSTNTGTLPIDYSLATLGATSGPEDLDGYPCSETGEVGRSVWYKLSNSPGLQVTITTKFSNFDTVLAAFRETTLLNCNDDIAVGTFQSALTLNITDSATYYVQVSGRKIPNPVYDYGAESGNLHVRFSVSAPPNDNFAQATAVPNLGGARRVFTEDATTQSGELVGIVCDGFSRPTGKTVWYSYVPGPRSVTINTVGSDFDTVLAVYSGPALNSLSLVACNDDISFPGNKQSQVTFGATAGTTYYVQVGGFEANAGKAVVNFN